MKKSKRTPRIKILVFLVVAIIAIVVVHLQMPVMIVKPYKKPSVKDPKDYGLEYEEMEFSVTKSINIKAYWSQVNNPDSVAANIICIHGIGNNRELWYPNAKRLKSLNIRAIMIDLRAHGKSGGRYTTYGHYEKEDLKIIVDKIESIYPETPLGIWGHSLGGAIGIQSMASDKRIDFGIIESTFTDLNETIYSYAKRFSKNTLPKFVIKKGISIAEKRAKFETDDIQPLESVKLIDQAILFVHGTDDKKINLSNSQKLFDQCNSESKEFYQIKGAKHNAIFKSGGPAYWDKLVEFIQGSI